MGTRAAEATLHRAELDLHYLRRFVIAESLHVAEHDRQTLLRGQAIDGPLDQPCCLAAQRLLLRPSLRVGQPICGAELIGRIAERIQTVRWSTLSPPQLVVTGVDGDS